MRTSAGRTGGGTQDAGSRATSSAARRPRRRGGRLGRLLFILPLLVYMLAVFAFPTVYNVYVSLHHFTLRSIVTGEAPFVGLENFTKIFADPTFLVASRNTLIFTVASLLVSYVLGLALALFFNQVFPASGLLRALLILPWLVPSIVGTSSWRWLFASDANGFVNRALAPFGIGPIEWLISPTGALVSVIVVNIWIGAAFNMVLLHSGLQSIPVSHYEAAQLDGANAVQRFRYVTMPALRPVTAVVITLGFIYTLKQFDIIWILTGGGPGNATQLLSTWSYTLSFINNDFGRGAAVSDVLLVLSMAVIAVYGLRTRRRSDD